jgi:predicted enzyme related to lactoylglutathione lyase
MFFFPALIGIGTRNGMRIPGRGWGMYPHFEVADVARTIERARKAGYRIAQEPRNYGWGIEAFVADPDGYIWALVSPSK